ncbi:MAG: nitrous oxide reductase family maturation protein NosD [Candidatus Thorarchaeota archaeon]
MQWKDRVRWIVAIFTLCLLVLHMIPYTVSFNQESAAVSHIAAISHDPFVIIGDVNFSDTASAEGWSGDGSPASPYIIENLEITLGISPVAAISITGTRVHFIIRGCYLTGPFATPSYGVHLENVANGQIDDTQCSGFSTGINITGCDSITVSSSNCSNNSDGIHIQSSNSSTVINNICSNTLIIGIQLVRSNSSIVSSNICNDGDINGIYMYNCYSSIVNDNVCNNNNYGLFLHTCNFSTVNHNTCNENAFSGIYLLRSHSSSAANNTCNSNREGMYVQEMDSSNVTGNSCILNELRGIAIQDCDFTLLTFNTITNTTVEYGLFITAGSTNNDVNWNAFAYSGAADCADVGSSNVFDHNYYSDYGGIDADEDGIGDTTHPIPNANSDTYPLIYYPFPPGWDQTPVNQAIEFGTSFSYLLDFTVTSTTAPYQLSVDDYVNFAVDTDDTIVSRTSPEVGIYPVKVIATNIYGFTTVGTFTLTVADTTPPTVTDAEDISFLEGEGGDYELQWTLSDLSPLNFVLLKNDSEVTSSTEPTTAVYFSTTIEDLAPGVYNYTIVATDIWDNMAYDTVIVTVLPIPLLDTLLPWLILSAAAVVIIIVSIVIFKRRK